VVSAKKILGLTGNRSCWLGVMVFGEHDLCSTSERLKVGGMSRGFGKTQRMILEQINRHPSRPVHITYGYSRNEATSRRSAAKKLEEAGRVVLRTKTVKGKDYLVALRSDRALTEEGRAVDPEAEARKSRQQWELTLFSDTARAVMELAHSSETHTPVHAERSWVSLADAYIEPANNNGSEPYLYHGHAGQRPLLTPTDRYPYVRYEGSDEASSWLTIERCREYLWNKTGGGQKYSDPGAGLAVPERSAHRTNPWVFPEATISLEEAERIERADLERAEYAGLMSVAPRR